MDKLMLLEDRLEKIRSTMKEYGTENFCMSYSGGKDSVVMSELIDMAVPDNKIPRVYADTGIELKMIRDFVKHKAETDDRIVMLKPETPIKKMLEEVGYPFKSKHHSYMVNYYQRAGLIPCVQKYVGGGYAYNARNCPKILRYQFTPENKLKISDKCCDELKKKPLEKYKKEHGYPYGIIGTMAAEGGRRSNATCLAFRGNKLKAFQPLAPVTKEWEDWFINEFNIEICAIYKPPYNFKRTG